MNANEKAEILTSEVLTRVGVPHGFSTRRGGVSLSPFDSLNFGNPGDLPPERKDPRANILENWGRVLAAMGCAGRRVVEVHQVHGGEVWVERREERKSDGAREKKAEGKPTPQPPPSGSVSDPKADAIVTDDAECVAAVRVADCAPVLLSDVRGRVVAAVHAGWRGVIAGVAGNAVRAMREMGACEVVAAVGPCIGPDAFEVGEEVAVEFGRVLGERAPVRAGAGGKSFVDLPRALEVQLREAGVREVDVLRRCTVSEPEMFYSHRRDRGMTGRMVGVIGVCARRG